MHLYQALAERVAEWRKLGYPHADYPALADILAWAADPEGNGFRLRPPQLRALETYWCLLLCLGTPHTADLYRCVVNTTGTPCFQHQPLRDVVIWYGLSQGIRDGILKEVAGNIQAFSFEGQVDLYLRHVIEDFFRDYGQVALALPADNVTRVTCHGLVQWPETLRCIGCPASTPGRNCTFAPKSTIRAKSIVL